MALLKNLSFAVRTDAADRKRRRLSFRYLRSVNFLPHVRDIAAGRFCF